MSRQAVCLERKYANMQRYSAFVIRDSAFGKTNNDAGLALEYRQETTMPTYVYEILAKDGKPTGEVFEIFQSMKDDTLATQPVTGKPCRRAVVAPNIAGEWSDTKSKSKLSNKNLERLGFTKYERKGKGYMERVAGKEGPKSISAED